MVQVLGNERSATIERFGCLHNELLNMTYLALRFSRYVNGVAMQHGKVSQQMFPEYHVHAITNGVHAATWLSQPFQDLFDKEIPEWRHDNQYLRSVYGIEPEAIAAAHLLGKQRLFNTVQQRTGFTLVHQIV
jgi:starch phosphorylase